MNGYDINDIPSVNPAEKQVIFEPFGESVTVEEVSKRLSNKTATCLFLMPFPEQKFTSELYLHGKKPASIWTTGQSVK